MVPYSGISDLAHCNLKGPYEREESQGQGPKRCDNGSRSQNDVIVEMGHGIGLQVSRSQKRQNADSNLEIRREMSLLHLDISQ